MTKPPFTAADMFDPDNRGGRRIPTAEEVCREAGIDPNKPADAVTAEEHERSAQVYGRVRRETERKFFGDDGP